MKMIDGLIKIIERTYSPEVMLVYEAHDTLTSGNNALGLPEIPCLTSIGLVIDRLTGVIPIDARPKLAELDERTHQAARQLSGYYGQIAADDENFAAYWQGGKTFAGALKELVPAEREKYPIKKRAFFESFTSFFKENKLKEKNELTRLLSYFEPFLAGYRASSVSLSTLRTDAYLGPFPVAVAGLILFSLAGMCFNAHITRGITQGHHIAEAITYIYGLVGIGAGTLLSNLERTAEQSIINNAHTNLVGKCDAADKAIASIRKYAEEQQATG